jgi:plastocyanin
MKKNLLTLSCLFILTAQLFSANINITITSFSYSPSATTANIGDVVTIAASTTHPLVQVDQTNWNTNTPTPMAGGWGTKTSAYTFTITTAVDIYYGCANHMATKQMKGMITVTSVGITTSSVSYAVSLFPNPVTCGDFTVKADGFAGSNGKIIIYNTEGEILETHSLIGPVTPVKSKLPSGVYFYDVMINNTKAYRGKFLNTSGK